MRDRIARGHYNRALARFANVGCLPLEAMALVVGHVGADFFSLAPPWGALECGVVLRLEAPLMA